MVALEHRPPSADVRPLRKTRAPPLVVFGHTMELRQVDGDRPHVPGVGRAGDRGLLGPHVPGIPRGDRGHAGAMVPHQESILVVQEVGEGFDPVGRHIGMGGEIAGGVELRMRRAAFSPALQDIVQQRLHARGSNVGILGDVPGWFEKRMRLAAFPPAVVHVVFERVHTGRPHVGIVLQIPGSVEELSGRMLLLPAAAAVILPWPPADQRFALAVGGQIPGLVEIGTEIRLRGGRHGAVSRRTSSGGQDVPEGRGEYRADVRRVKVGSGAGKLGNVSDFQASGRQRGCAEMALTPREAGERIPPPRLAPGALP